MNKDTIKYYVLLGLLKFVALIPLRVLYGLSDFIYFIFRHVMHYRQEVIVENLQRVFPEKTASERLDIQKRYYHFLGDLIVEIIKTLHISDKELNKRVKLVNTKLLDTVAAEGRPVFVMLGHYGNWEWGQLVYNRLHVPEVCGQIYRPVKDMASDRIMSAIRSRFKGINIPQETALRTLIKMNKEHRSFLVSFLADQHPNSEIMRHWTDFLGQESAYVAGAEEIGRRLNAAYFYLDIERTGRGFYTMTIRNIEPVATESEYPYTISYLRMMEASIRKQPETWLWSHRRWNYTRASYAQHMKEFHELLRQRTAQEEAQKEQQNK